MKNLEVYWHEGFTKVESWVDNRLLPFLRAVDAAQCSAGIVGQVGEVSVYHGKFFVALAHLASSGGKATAIDVFDDQSRNPDSAGAGSLECLQENIVKYGPTKLDYAFVKADSIALNAGIRSTYQEIADLSECFRSTANTRQSILVRTYFPLRMS